MLPTLSREFAWCQEPIAIHVQLRDYLASEGLQMWCQVEVWLDGGVLGRTSSFRRTSLVPQMRRYHAKLKKNLRPKCCISEKYLYFCSW